MPVGIKAPGGVDQRQVAVVHEVCQRDAERVVPLRVAQDQRQL